MAQNPFANSVCAVYSLFNFLESEVVEEGVLGLDSRDVLPIRKCAGVSTSPLSNSSPTKVNGLELTIPSTSCNTVSNSMRLTL